MVSIRNQFFYSFLYTYVSSPLSEGHKQHFLEFLKLDQSGHLKSLLNKYSQYSPLVYAAYSGNDVAIDVFIEFLGDDISNHISFSFFFFLLKHFYFFLRFDVLFKCQKKKG